MTNNQNTSSKINPLKFFENLYVYNGFQELLQSFRPSLGEILIGQEYDLKTDTMLIYELDQNTGETILNTLSFKEFFFRTVNKEFDLSCKYIDERVLEILNQEQKTEFLINIYITLEWLLTKINKDEYISKFNFSDQPIYDLFIFLDAKYSNYYQINSKYIRHKKEDSIFKKVSNELNARHKEYLFSFKWIRNSALFNLFYTELIKLEFIPENTAFSLFENSFGGSTETPQSKILWLPKGNNKITNKKLLFYLLNELLKNECLEQISLKTKLHKIIGYVFCDFEGKPFKKLNVAKSQATNVPRPFEKNYENYDSVDNLIDILVDKDSNGNLKTSSNFNCEL